VSVRRECPPLILCNRFNSKGLNFCPINQGFCLTHYWNGVARVKAPLALCQHTVPPYWYGCWGRGLPVHNCQAFSIDYPIQLFGSVCDATGRCGSSSRFTC
jgi:hypothetical protein